MKLYKTNLPVEKDTEISVTYKTDVKKPNMKLGVSFVDQPDDFVFFDVKKKSRDQWMEETFKLNKYKGKKLQLFLYSSRVMMQ